MTPFQATLFTPLIAHTSTFLAPISTINTSSHCFRVENVTLCDERRARCRRCLGNRLVRMRACRCCRVLIASAREIDNAH